MFPNILIGVPESLEVQTMNMAKAAAKFIEENLRFPSSEKVECVIADTTIGGVAVCEISQFTKLILLA